MTHVQTAVRAWIAPAKASRTGAKRQRGYRSAPFDERVLVFDTETTTDFTQRLLYGIAQLYQAGGLIYEALFLGDTLSEREIRIAQAYAEKVGLPVLSRADFVHKVFFPHVYALGALCVGFNLPFDLSRIALRAGVGRDRNIRKFRLTLSRYQTYCAIRIESISGRAAFIEFAPKSAMQPWEKPFFKGRFLDLSTLATALTGERFSLKRAARTFKTAHQKTGVELGKVSHEAIAYCHNDVTVTWELFEKLRDEYSRYPFATMENERKQSKNSLPITRVYSTASVAKATLKLMGFETPNLGTDDE